MPRIALSERLAAVCMGRPMACLEPAPATSRGVPEEAASPTRRASSRSSMGRISEEAVTNASRRPPRPRFPGVPGRLAPVQGEYLGRVQEPLGVEHRLDPHLLRQVGLAELYAHEV